MGWCNRCRKDFSSEGDSCPACWEKVRAERRSARKELIKKVWAGEPCRTHTDRGVLEVRIRPPEMFYGATWETINGSLQEQIKPFVRGYAGMLTLVGPAGTGKTWTAWGTTFATIIDHANCHFVDWYDLNRWAMDSRLYGDSGDAGREILYALECCDLLVIDEFAVTKLHEAEHTSVLGIISHRVNHKRRTLLATTKNEAEIVECVGEAMLSRINGGIVIKMQGKDRRLRP